MRKTFSWAFRFGRKAKIVEPEKFKVKYEVHGSAEWSAGGDE